MRKRNTTEGETATEETGAEVVVAAAAAEELKLPIERWAEACGWVGSERNPEYWKFAATKIFKRWPHGFEITRSDFDAAVAEMDRQTIR